MDGVEIVMAVEERFGIEIKDAEAEQLRTPGQLIDLVGSKMIMTPMAQCRTRRAFHIIRRTFQRRCGLDRKSIRTDARLETLVPTTSRLTVWTSLESEFGAATWPILFYPWSIVFVMSLCGAGAYGLAQTLDQSTWSSWTAGVATLALLWLALNPFRTAFRGRMQTVGDLARFLAGQAPALFAPFHSWSRIEVAHEVEAIVVDVLGCKKYREDADFVKDLGLS